jgi:hypothetical protein
LREHTTALLAPQERQLDNARLSAAASASFVQSCKPEEKAKFAQERRRAPQKIITKEGSSSAIAAKIVRVMLAALKIGWTVEFGANPVQGRGCHPLWEKFYQNITGGATHCSR